MTDGVSAADARLRAATLEMAGRTASQIARAVALELAEARHAEQVAAGAPPSAIQAAVDEINMAAGRVRVAAQSLRRADLEVAAARDELMVAMTGAAVAA